MWAIFGDTVIIKWVLPTFDALEIFYDVLFNLTLGLSDWKHDNFVLYDENILKFRTYKLLNQVTDKMAWLVKLQLRFGIHLHNVHISLCNLF